MLQQLGWIDVADTKRRTPRISDSTLRSEEKLFRLRKELLTLRKDPEGFIEFVFGSSDRNWVDRCSSIIVEDGGSQ